MGSEIRLRGFATTVIDECVSACGLIWMSGARRHLNANTRVGFHAAFVVRNGLPVETGMGNAEIGSFLTHLGLSREAIQFVTAAPPQGIRWLTHNDAHRLGIEIVERDQQNTKPDDQNEPPAYVTKPAPKDTAKARMIDMAVLASRLVIALECSNLYRVNQQKLKALHSELMKQGQRFGDRFIDFLGIELKERAREVRRDGLDRFCATQRENFRRAGLTNIYLN